MAKVTIRSETQIEEDDYDKIMEFAQRDDSEQNVMLRDLPKLIESTIDFNIKSILAQIAGIESKRATIVDTTVGLVDAQGNPLIAPGGNGDDQTP